jgi:hypothetical protein
LNGEVTGTDNATAAPPSSSPLESLKKWLGEFCRLHQVSVQIIDGHDRVVLGPFNAPEFCRRVGHSLLGACPVDCGRPYTSSPTSQARESFHCPFHLSNVAWTQPIHDDEVWTVIVGRTFASQRQINGCFEIIHDIDEALTALGSIRWKDETQLEAVARFLQVSLDLVLPALRSRGPTRGQLSAVARLLESSLEMILPGSTRSEAQNSAAP